MHYLALCCIVKDEEPFLKEWLAYHAVLGVEHFYIYDNMSARPVSEVLQGFCQPSQVTIREIDGRGIQMEAYLDCLQNFGKDCHWLGFIDADEFICPLLDDDLRLLLPEFEAWAALVLSWDSFGSNGHLSRPDGLVLDNYTEHFLPEQEISNLHIKSIIKPEQTLAVRSPHFFHYQPGTHAVNTQRFPVVNTPFSYLCHDLVKLNHYYYRSQQDFQNKVNRGNAHRNNFQRSMDSFYDQAVKKTQPEKSGTRFSAQVKQILADDRLPEPSILAAAKASLADNLTLAMDLLEADKHQGAALCLAQASQYYPDQPEIWILLAALARLGKRSDRARQLLRHGASFGLEPGLLAELSRLEKDADQMGQGGQSKIMDFCARFLEARQKAKTV